MKIAFFLRKFPNLSQTFVLNQITGLIDRGHEVHIYAQKKGEYEVQHSCVDDYKLLEKAYFYGAPNVIDGGRVRETLGLVFTVCAMTIRRPNLVLSLVRQNKMAQDVPFLQKMLLIELLGSEPNRYDVVHCHFGPNGNLGALLKKIGAIKAKLVTTFHGFDLSKYLLSHGNGVYEGLFEIGDLFLPISDRWKAELIKLGCDPQKIVVHHMGVETDTFAQAPRNPGNREYINLLTVGRLVEKKGVSFGIQAFSRVAGDFPNLRYLIAGDGPLRSELEDLVEELNLKHRIAMLGWKKQDEISELMKSADIILAPSVVDAEGDQEGIPVVLMEALAMGVPVLSTWHSGIPELIEDSVSGFLVPERNSVALADRLRYLLEHPVTWAEMGRAGRKKIENQFDVNKLNDELEGLFAAHQ